MSYELKTRKTDSNGWLWELLKDGLPVQGGMGYKTKKAALEAAVVPHEPHPEDPHIDTDDPKGHPWATS